MKNILTYCSLLGILAGTSYLPEEEMYLCEEHIVALITVLIKLTISKASKSYLQTCVHISPKLSVSYQFGIECQRDTVVATLACLALTLIHLDRK